MAAMADRTQRPIAASLSAAGLFVGESHHGADFRMTPRRYPFHVVAYVLSGAGQWNDEPVAAGDVVIAPRGVRYQFTDAPGSPMSLYVLCIGFKCDAPPAGILSGNALLADMVRDMLRRMLFEQTLQKRAADLMMVGLAQQLLALLHRAKPTSSEGTMRDAVKEYIAQMAQTFFDDADIDTVAARLRISRRRFTDLFRQLTGETWHTRRRSLQLAHARRLLRETDRTVVAVAFECGFADLSSFYRAFKRAEGVTPIGWRGGEKQSR